MISYKFVGYRYYDANQVDDELEALRAELASEKSLHDEWKVSATRLAATLIERDEQLAALQAQVAEAEKKLYTTPVPDAVAIYGKELGYGGNAELRFLPGKSVPWETKLYARPVPAAVPDPLPNPVTRDNERKAYVAGWNSCRDATLAAMQSQVAKAEKQEPLYERECMKCGGGTRSHDKECPRYARPVPAAVPDMTGYPPPPPTEQDSMDAARKYGLAAVPDGAFHVPTLEAVLRGLKSEDDSTQLRAIISEVETMLAAAQSQPAAVPDGWKEAARNAKKITANVCRDYPETAVAHINGLADLLLAAAQSAPSSGKCRDGGNKCAGCAPSECHWVQPEAQSAPKLAAVPDGLRYLVGRYIKNEGGPFEYVTMIGPIERDSPMHKAWIQVRDWLAAAQESKP